MTPQTSPAPTSAPASARSIPAPPEPGQVVQVRGAVWAVTNVAVQGLPHSSADDAQAAEEFEIVLILGTWILAISQFTQPLGETAPQNWGLGQWLV